MDIKVLGFQGFFSKDGKKEYVKVFYSFPFDAYSSGEGEQCSSFVLPSSNVSDLIIGGFYSVDFQTFMSYDGTFKSRPVGLVPLR